MKKQQKSLILGLAAAASISLSACGPKNKNPNEIIFWSSFGQSYSNALDTIVAKAHDQTGLDINHVSKGSYDDTLEAMIPALMTNNYPHMTMGYPDHFALYLADDSLIALDEYLSETEINDYISDYMGENYFTSYGERHLYGVPFNKSTEVLGYNGTFVAYCKYLCDNEVTLGANTFTSADDLGTLPVTWDEWAAKGPTYMKVYDYLIDSGKVLCGKQDVDGKTHDFTLANKSELKEVTNDLGEKELVYKTGHTGEIGLIDFSILTTKKTNTRLMSWDATDNAFITLCRQWGADYTNLDLNKNNQGNSGVAFQTGDVLFGSSRNSSKTKVKDFLEFFKGLSNQRIFGTPKELNGTYSSDAFQDGSVMFMICSSGGLSYNTGTWHNNFSIAPIPYKDAQHKYVISQGANIAITDKGNYEDCIKVLKALTTGDTQVEWCLKTGYYPCSHSAADSKKYTDFLKEGTDEAIAEYAQEHGMTVDQRKAEVYSNPARVAYRDGSKVNQEHYMVRTGPNNTLGATDWHKFVDAAFSGSSGVRKAVKNILTRVFTDYGKEAGLTLDKILNEALESSDIPDNVNVIKN